MGNYFLHIPSLQSLVVLLLKFTSIIDFEASKASFIWLGVNDFFDKNTLGGRMKICLTFYQMVYFQISSDATETVLNWIDSIFIVI